MAFEFLQAFARFYVDRQEYDRTLKSMESDASRTAQRIEKTLAVQAGSPEFGAMSISDLRARSDATNQVSQAIDTHNKKQKDQAAGALEVTRSIREVSRGLASDLNPALGGAVSGLVAGAQAAKAFGAGVGIAVGGLAIASVLIGEYIQKVKAAQEAQVALNVAKLAEDFGAVDAQVKQSIADLERFNEQQKVIAKGQLLPGVGHTPVHTQLSDVKMVLHTPVHTQSRRKATEKAQVAYVAAKMNFGSRATPATWSRLVAARRRVGDPSPMELVAIRRCRYVAEPVKARASRFVPDERRGDPSLVIRLGTGV